MKDYKKCDDIKEKVSVLKHQRRELQAESKRLTKSNSKSKWYYKKKAAQGSVSSEDKSESGSSRSTTPYYRPSAKTQRLRSSQLCVSVKTKHNSRD